MATAFFVGREGIGGEAKETHLGVVVVVECTEEEKRIAGMAYYDVCPRVSLLLSLDR